VACRPCTWLRSSFRPSTASTSGPTSPDARWRSHPASPGYPPPAGPSADSPHLDLLEHHPLRHPRPSPSGPCSGTVAAGAGSPAGRSHSGMRRTQVHRHVKARRQPDLHVLKVPAHRRISSRVRGTMRPLVRQAG
jgi:hypothetical protein